MSALLTDEAMGAALGQLWHEAIPDDHRDIFQAFVRFHATGGREALVRRLMEVEDSDGFALCGNRQDAEAVVTALFGEAA